MRASWPAAAGSSIRLCTTSDSLRVHGTVEGNASTTPLCTVQLWRNTACNIIAYIAVVAAVSDFAPTEPHARVLWSCCWSCCCAVHRVNSAACVGFTHSAIAPSELPGGMAILREGVVLHLLEPHAVRLQVLLELRVHGLHLISQPKQSCVPPAPTPICLYCLARAACGRSHVLSM